MVRCTLLCSEIAIPQQSKTAIDAHVVSQRSGAGTIKHCLTLDATVEGSTLWTKEITFEVTAPFEVPDLENLDAFVIAALFPAMEVGGTLRIHGPVSRQLIRNVLDYQAAWSLAAPDHCRPFNLDVAEIDDRPTTRRDPHPKAILAFTAGMDSMLALCRNASGDAGPTGHEIGATVFIRASRFGRGRDSDSADLIEKLRQASDVWGVPLAVVHTNITDVVGRDVLSHGTWLGASLNLFAGRFDVGLVGSSITSFAPGYEIYGSHPLMDPLLSGGQLSIRNDEGYFERVQKADLLARYQSATKDLRVCFHPYKVDQNCCRCEKCIRSMLCFIASGHPIPPAFPDGLRLSDIGIGMGKRAALEWGPLILRYAERYGTSDHPAMRVLRRRYRVKKAKFIIKVLWKRISTGTLPHRWRIFDRI